MTAALSILYVCTGNACRSPLAERLTLARLAELRPSRTENMAISSAGVRALVGAPMHPLAEAELRRLGGSPEGFRARQLNGWLVREADLVLTATQWHRSQVLVEEPRALRRTFTMREFARLVGGRPRPGALPDLVADVAMDRGSMPPDASDIADPIGRSADVHREVADAVAASVDEIAPVLAAAIIAAERDRLP